MGCHESLGHLSWTLPLTGSVVPGRSAHRSFPLSCYADLSRCQLQSHRAWGLTRGQGSRSCPETSVCWWLGKDIF